jgi:hypothetical protein
MATFYDIYQNYLQNPYSGVNALPGVNPSSGIMNTNTISPIGGDSMGVSPVASINTNPNVTNTTPGTGIMGTNINFSDIAKAIGFAMNPALGIANLAATQVLGKSPMDMAMEAMGISGFGRTDNDFATAGVFGGDDSSSTGTANATDTGDMGSEAANDAASASAAAGGSGGGGGADSAGDGGDGYATGGRIGYAEGGTTTYLTPTEFFETSDTRKEWTKILDELDEIVYSGQYANPEKAEYIKNLEDKKNKLYAQSWDEYYKSEADAALKQQTTPTEDFSDSSKYTVGPDGNIYEKGSGKLVSTNAQTTPTEDFSDYLNTTTINTNAQTKPTVAEQIISTNNLSPTLTSVAEKLFPQGDFLNIKETATSPTEYNIKATEDLVENLPGGIH